MKNAFGAFFICARAEKSGRLFVRTRSRCEIFYETFGLNKIATTGTGPVRTEPGSKALSILRILGAKYFSDF